MRRPFPALLLSALAALACGRADAALDGPGPAVWAAVAAPSAGPARVIGSYANGCVAGARALPAEGPGYQVLRLSRNRFYGHPDLIAFVEDFGRRVAAAGLGTAAVGDLAQPRGGPMPYGHASHQTGLDVDIWFRLDLPPLPHAQRERLEEMSMVDPAGPRVDPLRWSPRQAEMVRLAAADPRVSRIFVAPAVKLALCERHWPDRSWLRKLRPWYGHTGHFHIRLHCPPDDPLCREQEPPPPGDGCGEELTSWLTSPPRPPSPPAPRPPLPDACLGLPAEPAAARRRRRGLRAPRGAAMLTPLQSGRKRRCR